MNCQKCGEQIHGFTGYIPGTGKVCFLCYQDYLQNQKEADK